MKNLHLDSFTISLIAFFIVVCCIVIFSSQVDVAKEKTKQLELQLQLENVTK